jgi:ribose-phosphate pyrophosphokinase
MSVSIVGCEFGHTKTTFPGGESCIRVALGTFFDEELTLQLDFESNGDLIDLALLADALRREHRGVKLNLFMPYVPYARQDRVCNPGESLSIRVVADFINSLKFHMVVVADPHSDVTTALLDNVVAYAQDFGVDRVARRVGADNTIIVAPDAGASKKASKFARAGGFSGLIQAEKVRDLLTGKILETRVPDILVGDMDFLIVDDICDGGRTFTELAKVLRTKTTGKIMLYVTHGIFSAGEKVFDGLIDDVYTANPVGATGKAAVASGRVKVL